MQIISEKKLENATMELQIDVPLEQVESEYRAVFNKLKDIVKLDGFRKGKAPLHLVENRFKNEADQEVADNLLKNNFLEAVQEKQFNPIAMPRYEFDTISRNKQFSFKVTFEIPPTVELGKYTGIAADEMTCVINDDNVMAEIDAIRERYAKIEKKDESEPVQNGDLAKIKVRRIDDVKDADIASVEFKEYSIVVGKSKDESALDSDLVGMKMNEEKNVDVKYPKDYYLSDLAGQKVTYHVIVTEISKVELPELNEEFAKQTGYASADEFRTRTREYLEKFVNERSKGEAKGQILKEIVEASTFDLPDTMVLNEMDGQFRKLQERAQYYSENMDEFATIMGVEPEVFKNNLRQRALQMLKASLVLIKIAEKEEMKVDENRYKEVIENFAKRNNTTVEDVEKTITENNSRHTIESELLLDKAMDFIYENAKIKKLKPVPLEEFIKNLDKTERA